jgi:hypothetical protein
MRDRLPDIQIRIGENPHSFLEQMRKVALQAKKFDVELHNNFSGQGLDILNISPQLSNSHVGLLGQFINNPNKPSIMLVEVRAERWLPEPPTYKTYVEAANEVIKPLLQSYNLTFGTKYRLTIESQKSLEPKLPPRANQRFKEFVTLANKQILHPYDWERFYYFIYACSSRNVKVIQEDVEELLLSSGFSEQNSEEIANVFWHGVSLLRLSK